jgi:hypothetical protein
MITKIVKITLQLSFIKIYGIFLNAVEQVYLQVSKCP